MKHKIFIFFLLLFGLNLSAQTKPKENLLPKNQLIFALGFGYGDGLNSLSRRPTIGIGYERRLFRWLSLSTHILSYYQNYLDLISDSDVLLDIKRGSTSPFITKEQQDKLNNSGVKQLYPGFVIKSWSVPMDVGVTFYPLCKKHHRIGINIGFSMTYETHSYYKDFFTGNLILADGTKKAIFLSVPTEYRNISPGIVSKIHYQYIFDKASIGFRFGNCNGVIDEFGRNEPVWDTSLFYAYQF